MSHEDRLIAYVARAVASGEVRADVTQTLSAQGWTPTEIEEAIAATNIPFTEVKAPKPGARMTGVDYYLYALTFGTFGFGAYSLIFVLNVSLEITLDPEAYLSTSILRRAMSTMMVVLPVALVCILYDLLRTARAPKRHLSTTRRWLFLGIMLIAAAVLMINVAAQIYVYLNGDPKPALLWQSMATAAVLLWTLVFFGSNQRRFRLWWNAGLLAVFAATAIGALVWGFSITGTPAYAAMKQNDGKRITDLRTLGGYNRCKDYGIAPRDAANIPAYCVNLPKGLPDLRDPVTDAPYTVTKATDTDYEVCATFEVTTHIPEHHGTEGFIFDGLRGCLGYGRANKDAGWRLR